MSLTFAVSAVICRKDQEINTLNSKLEDEQNLVAQLKRKIKELQVRDQKLTNSLYSCILKTKIVLIV